MTDVLFAQKYKLIIMVTFRNNNNRRTSFRRNDRNYKSNGDRQKFSSNFSNNDNNFKRKSPGRNNHNAPKLIEKYNDLAREASSNGDKILSENYLQHADHFTRVLNDRESMKREKLFDIKDNPSADIQDISTELQEKDNIENSDNETDKTSSKVQLEVS